MSSKEPDRQPEVGEVVEDERAPSTALERVAARGAVLERWRRAPVPALQAAAVAATSFAAGAAVVAVASRHRQRGRAMKARPRNGAVQKPPPIVGEIVATRSFLVDVHILRRP